MSILAMSAAMLLTAAPAEPVAPPVSPVPVEPFVMPPATPMLGGADSATEPDSKIPAEPVLEAEPASSPIQSSVPPPAVAPPEEPDAQGSEPGPVQDEIVVTAQRRNAVGDPLEKLNAKSFSVTQDVDKAVVGPVARAYERALPSPLRGGLRNFLNNLHEPNVALNFLLQLKAGKAFETLGRFAINTTIGGAGLFDVAKRHPFNLPRRPNGFAYTMGFYGVMPGPFMFLPLIGPTTLRDLLGGGLDGLVLPLSVGRPFNRITYTVPTAAVRELDNRNQFDEQLSKMLGIADPYAAAREFYLEKRKAEIDNLRGVRRGAGIPTSKPIDSGDPITLP